MTEWIAGFVGAELAVPVSYGVMGLLALLGLLVLIWLLRRLGKGTFISGGRNAQPRLSVQDAAPVDSHRRLILVRRDDVEHLLLIGGNTDIVVEQNIRQGGAGTRAVQSAEPAVREQRPLARDTGPYPAPQAHPAPPVAPQRPLAAPAPQPRPVTITPPLARTEPRLDPLMPIASAPRTSEAAPAPQLRAAPASPQNLDDELEKMLGEFNVFPQQKS